MKELHVMDHVVTRKELQQSYLQTRKLTEKLCAPLAVEDYVIQSIEDVSPPKWHLAHTSWFFETFLLTPSLPNYSVFNSHFHYLFNSYYQHIGNPYPRVRRGVLSRPTVEIVYRYREYIDQHMLELIERCDEQQFAAISSLLTLGLHHEQQHQELLLMDIKHNFAMHLDYPVYQQRIYEDNSVCLPPIPSAFTFAEGGMIQVGHHGKSFCFDNELPRHVQILKPFAFAEYLVTNEEYIEFIDAGGYQAPEWWLADGWETIQKNHWQSPLYWQKQAGKWYVFTLSGLQAINPHEPVVHVSYYEADAYARWRGARLPTEVEWEHIAINKNGVNTEGNFLESNIYHPRCVTNIANAPQQLFGDVWEWTSSAYIPYPGYKPLDGALGEYNGKFMSNQMVLRGGSCTTPAAHIRHSYRNFFQPDKRWQFAGIRLAKDA